MTMKVKFQNPPTFPMKRHAKNWQQASIAFKQLLEIQETMYATHKTLSNLCNVYHSSFSK